MDPNPSNAVPVAGIPLSIYSDQLDTGGGLGLFPSSNNQQIDTASRDNPHSGRRCIRYSWNGQDVPNNGTPEHTFAGFDLVVSQDLTTLSSAAGRNLSAAGYTKLTFWLRGTLTENTTIKVEGPGNGNSNTILPSVTVTSLSNNWQQFTINASPGDFNNVKEFFKLTFVFAQPSGTTVAGQGGTVFADDVQFSK